MDPHIAYLSTIALDRPDTYDRMIDVLLAVCDDWYLEGRIDLLDTYIGYFIATMDRHLSLIHI